MTQAVPGFESVSPRAIPEGASEIRLFSKCRNEILRLPAFLRHYRRLGVRRFFIADNASTDGSTEYLRRQPDVHVFRTEQSFRAARGGTDWLNALLSRYGVGHWCVTVDVDELLCYPGSESAGLVELTAYLDAHGYEVLPCLLLDLYPSGPLSSSAYRSGDDLDDLADVVRAAPFFDAAPYVRIPHHECPFFLTYGGVRERVFFPESRGGWRRRLHVTLYHRAILSIPLLRSIPWILKRRPAFPPCLTKVPLAKWDARSRYLNVNHFISDKTLPPESGVLLHFKLLHDFHARAEHEAVRGEYYDGAIEWRRYAATLKTRGDLTFVHEDSVRFEGTAQLVRLELMQDSATWRAARGERAAVPAARSAS